MWQFSRRNQNKNQNVLTRIVIMNSLKNQIIKQLEPLTKEEKELLEKAFDFSEDAHRNQLRQSGEPFINHPLRVALTVSKMKLGVNAVISSLLHDVVEDTEIPLKDIEKNFNSEVAFLVQALTKINKIKYQEDASEEALEATKENFRNMILAMAKDLRVILIKLADRLDNMKTLWALPLSKQKTKASETLDIFAPLAYRLGLTDIGAQLEDLAFPYVYPEEYKLTRKIVGKRQVQLETIPKNFSAISRTKIKKKII